MEIEESIAEIWDAVLGIRMFEEVSLVCDSVTKLVGEGEGEETKILGWGCADCKLAVEEGTNSVRDEITTILVLETTKGVPVNVGFEMESPDIVDV